MKRCKKCGILMPENNKEERELYLNGIDYYFDKKIELFVCGFCDDSFIDSSMVFNNEDFYDNDPVW